MMDLNKLDMTGITFEKIQQFGKDSIISYIFVKHILKDLKEDDKDLEVCCKICDKPMIDIYEEFLKLSDDEKLDYLFGDD